jgi:hypothetical protein
MFPYREYGVRRAGFLAVRIPRLWGKFILTVCVESEALRVDESIRAT